MKILLIGEFSNVHATLADGLRHLGHQVTVASNGDYWKNYPRDIDLKRKSMTKWSGMLLLIKLVIHMYHSFSGYDIVQFISPQFADLEGQRLIPIFKHICKHNRKIVMCAFGMDYFWVDVNIKKKPLRYSDFNFGDKLRTETYTEEIKKVFSSPLSEKMNRLVANRSDAIIAGLYEYLVTYQNTEYNNKTFFIPFPIKTTDEGTHDLDIHKRANNAENASPYPIKFFIGINVERSSYKGTDIMSEALEALKKIYPERMTIIKAENIPYNEYQNLMSDSDIILDQLYSYTPAMNALLAMSKGLIVVGGGEEENYEVLDEKELRPIVNVQPNKYSVYHELEHIILHPELIPQLKEQSREYIQKHHDYVKVAKRYEKLYNHLLNE